jgi:hypothetical protein
MLKSIQNKEKHTSVDGVEIIIMLQVTYQIQNSMIVR